MVASRPSTARGCCEISRGGGSLRLGLSTGCTDSAANHGLSSWAGSSVAFSVPEAVRRRHDVCRVHCSLARLRNPYADPKRQLFPRIIFSERQHAELDSEMALSGVGSKGGRWRVACLHYSGADGTGGRV